MPTRLTTGAYVLHAGIEKWHRDEQRARAVHAMAADAYPQFQSMSPSAFLRVLAAGEIATGALLVTPFVSPIMAGLALTGFSAGLVGLYAQTPGLRRPGSIWPSQQGIGISKDIWMLGVGIGLLIDGIADRIGKR